jgi:uncharacterized protein YraI
LFEDRPGNGRGREKKDGLMNFTRITLLAGLGLAAASLTPVMASAAFNGWTDRPTSQRAGPGPEYPRVGFIPAGQQVRIYGCLRGVTQCDVSWRGNRGWVPGNALNGFYRNKRVPLITFGPQLGLPFITFNFGYWDDHYRGKPFWKERGKWDRDWKQGGDWKKGDRGTMGDGDWKKNRDNDAWKKDDNGGKTGDSGDWKKRGGNDGWKKNNDEGPSPANMPKQFDNKPDSGKGFGDKRKGPRQQQDDCKPGTPDCNPQ